MIRAESTKGKYNKASSPAADVVSMVDRQDKMNKEKARGEDERIDGLQVHFGSCGSIVAMQIKCYK